MQKEKKFNIDLSKNEPCEIGYTLRSWEGGTNLVQSIFKDSTLAKDDMVYVKNVGYGYVVEFKDETFDMTAVSDKIWDDDSYYHSKEEWRVRFYRIKIGTKYATARSDAVKVNLKCWFYNKFLKSKKSSTKYVPNDCPFCGKEMTPNRECDCPRTQALLKMEAEMWLLKDSTDKYLKMTEKRRIYDVDKCEQLFQEELNKIKTFGSAEEYHKEYDRLYKEKQEQIKKAEIPDSFYEELEASVIKEQAEIRKRYVAILKKLKEEELKNQPVKA